MRSIIKCVCVHSCVLPPSKRPNGSIFASPDSSSVSFSIPSLLGLLSRLRFASTSSLYILFAGGRPLFLGVGRTISGSGELAGLFDCLSLYAAILELDFLLDGEGGLGVEEAGGLPLLRLISIKNF